MKKSLLFALLLAPFFISAQNFRADSVVLNTVNPLSCDTIDVDMHTYLGCINFVQGASSYAINGSTIDLSVNYTSSPICAGAISLPVFNFSLLNIPSGTYSLVGSAYLDGRVVNSVTGPSLVVAACTTTTVNEEAIQRVRIYPNPTTDFIYIDDLAKTQDNVQIQLLDIKGSEISLPVRYSGNRMILDLASQESGIYFLRISAEGSQRLEKIIVR